MGLIDVLKQPDLIKYAKFLSTFFSRYFLSYNKNGDELPLPFVEAVIATLVIFKIHESINTGLPVLVNGKCWI